MLRLGRTHSPRVFHGAVGLPGFELAMAQLRELDVSEPLNDDDRLDSPSLLAAILKAAPFLRRLFAHGWGKGYRGESTASAMAHVLAAHPVSLHKLSVSLLVPAFLRRSFNAS